VDAQEGPMPQTRFVLKKALAMGHRIIVVVNKIDKPAARIDYVLDKTLDLFLELGASDEIANFPVVYAVAKQGKAGLESDQEKMTDISPIFESIMKYIPAPTGDVSAPLQMLTVSTNYDNYLGRVAIGRIYNGVLKANQDIMHISREGVMKKCRLTSVRTFLGLEKVSVNEVAAGDIVAVSGIENITIGDTIAAVDNPIALPILEIEEPTVKMTFMVNDSPFAGTEGEFTTSRQIRERLYRELQNDVALRVEDGPNGDWIVAGRGELHLAILIERLRREGFELQVSRPRVILKEVDGKTLAPFEQVFIETPEASSGIVIQKLGSRHGILKNIQTTDGIASLEFLIPTKGLFGYRHEFLTDTRGLGIMNTTFAGYEEDNGAWKERDQGSLVAHESGVTNMYGLLNIQDRGELFYGVAVKVYKGEVVGQNSHSGDLRVNVCKTKNLSNMRSKGDGVSEYFNTPRVMTLEDSLEYIGDDELVEVTPKSVRIRKIILDEDDAKRRSKGIN